MAIQRTVQLPPLWGDNARPQDRIETVQVHLRDYEVEILQTEHRYDSHLMESPKEAGHVVARMRADMCMQLAEQLYDCMEFADYQDFESFSVVMRGRVQVLRRRE